MKYTKEEMLSKVDHTLLKPEATWPQIRTLCDEAIANHCASVCINTCYVKQAVEYMAGRVPVCCVVGFPLGAMDTKSKAFEAKTAIEIGDIRDFPHLSAFMETARPEVVLHLAAQPIVRTSYLYPRETFETNVMGTVNLLEAIRRYNAQHAEKVQSFLNVTTDKVYENPDLADHAFREDEKLDGYDPYSNSKSCSELVTHSYQKSFFSPGADPSATVTAISTARAGNVIGGGDFAVDRIIPDCVRDTIAGRTIHVRNPYSTRPYQHVLEPLYVYLLIAMTQAQGQQTTGTQASAASAEMNEAGHDERTTETLARDVAGCYNVGPDEVDAITTGALADLFVQSWGAGAAWHTDAEANAPHEAAYLKLDTQKLKERFHWQPRWHVTEAVQETVAWYHAWSEGADMRALTEQQIRAFLADEREKSRT